LLNLAGTVSVGRPGNLIVLDPIGLNNAYNDDVQLSGQSLHSLADLADMNSPVMQVLQSQISQQLNVVKHNEFDPIPTNGLLDGVIYVLWLCHLVVGEQQV